MPSNPGQSFLSHQHHIRMYPPLRQSVSNGYQLCTLTVIAVADGALILAHHGNSHEEYVHDTLPSVRAISTVTC